MTPPKKASSKKSVKQRLPIKTKVMRELMFTSGGRCAMTGCGLSLISPSGGWVGTIAHIVAAEPGGPRGSDPLSAEDRRSFDNLLLMCGTHGREVDDVDTGEAEFPIDRLRAMKEAHETKVSQAIDQAIDDEVKGVRGAVGLLDTALRLSTDAKTAAGLAEMLDEDDPSDLLPGLQEVRATLQRVSQVGLDALSQVLGVWLLHIYDVKDQVHHFGDPSGTWSVVPMETVDNRVGRGQDRGWTLALDELQTRGVIEAVADEYDHDYVFREPWELNGSSEKYNFWTCAGEFLIAAHGLEISHWVRTLDFSIFDRMAAKDRTVPWR